MSDADRKVAFLDGNYDEALGLAEEARAYLLARRESGAREEAAIDRMAISCATLKVTSRLTQVIAWLLVQRAVQAGEMTREEAEKPEHRLSGEAACSPDMPVEGEALPDDLGDLMERSWRLYQRVARLDSMMEEGAAEIAGAD